MTFKEKINFRFPELIVNLTKFSNERKTAPHQDMLLCLAVTAASAFYEFEYFVPEIAGNLIRKLLLILFAVVWIWCSFLNGFWKKYRFLVFTALFWIIPRLIIIVKDGTPIRNYNKFLDAGAQYSRVLVQFSLSGLSGLLNASVILSTVVLLVWCAAAFYAGTAFRKITNRL